MNRLEIVPLYLGDRAVLLDRLARRVAPAFGLEPRLRLPWFDPESCFDPERGQYDSTRLLRGLLAPSPPEGGGRRLGVAGVDLFVPVLTYVFGEAQLDGSAAVVSVHRLRSEAYGLPPDPELLAARLEKEAVHELGHTYGLVHCLRLECAMRSSTYVEEIDLKPSTLCEACEEAVRKGRAEGVERARARPVLLPGSKIA